MDQIRTQPVDSLWPRQRTWIGGAGQVAICISQAIATGATL